MYYASLFVIPRCLIKFIYPLYRHVLDLPIRVYTALLTGPALIVVIDLLDTQGLIWTSLNVGIV